MNGGPDHTTDRGHGEHSGASSSHKPHKPTVGFAPNDFLDGREPGDWRTRYPDPAAQKEIRFEAWYIACHLGFVPALMFALFFARLKFITDRSLEPLWHALTAWLGGTLGGTLFSAKWLYHAVAKWTWNRDRRLWRLFTPHLSGALSFGILMLASSGIVRLFDPLSLRSLRAVVGVGFLIGYFSDNAVAKLTEIANTLFGSIRHSATAAVPGRDVKAITSKSEVDHSEHQNESPAD